MTTERWRDIYLPGHGETTAWELFHENSKRTLYSLPRLDEDHWSSGELLSFDAFPVRALPRTLIPLEKALFEVIRQSAPPHTMEPRPLSMEELATILHCAGGIPAEHGFLGAFSHVRQAGFPASLQSIETIFYTREVVGLPVGLYAFDARLHELRQLVVGDLTADIAAALVANHYAVTASLLIFLVARIERSIDTYGDRGYRSVLIESGRWLRILELVATALDLGCVGITEFFDRKLDVLLGLDGLLTSTIQVAAIGGIAGDRIAP